jgi:thiol-disulfide isomerase/thioredoxin
MAERRRGSIGKRRVAATVGVAAALGVALYVTLAGQGNGGDFAACPDAAPRAEALDSLVTGEVAAFRIAEEPEKLASLSFTGPNGDPMTLGDFAGKVTLVNIWATWCAPCRQEMPALDRLQAELGGEDFVVVPISIDTADPARPANFLKEIGVERLPLYTDRSTAIFQVLKQRGLALGLPVTLLLDRNGCRLGHMNGPAEWDSFDGRSLIEAAIGRDPAAVPQS